MKRPWQTLVAAALGSAVCLLVAQPRPSAQADLLASVLERAAAYVNDFEQQLSGLVAEETYSQDSGTLHRRLESDLLLVRVPGDARYMQFRDVFEVDGSAVRNREERLTRLFLDPSASAAQQLRAITEESARFNIGRIQRTMNMPTLALVFLRAENQHGSTFRLTRSTAPELARRGDEATRFEAPAGTVVVSFEEHPRNTLIRSTGGRDLPSHGRFWLDPTTGTVLDTELVAEDTHVTGVVDVHYELEPTFGSMVPLEMREQYRAPGTISVQGDATYAHFRSFHVDTSADIQQPK